MSLSSIAFVVVLTVAVSSKSYFAGKRERVWNPMFYVINGEKKRILMSACDKKDHFAALYASSIIMECSIRINL